MFNFCYMHCKGDTFHQALTRSRIQARSKRVIGVAALSASLKGAQICICVPSNVHIRAPCTVNNFPFGNFLKWGGRGEGGGYFRNSPVPLVSVYPGHINNSNKQKWLSSKQTPPEKPRHTATTRQHLSEYFEAIDVAYFYCHKSERISICRIGCWSEEVIFNMNQMLSV